MPKILWDDRPQAPILNIPVCLRTGEITWGSSPRTLQIDNHVAFPLPWLQAKNVDWHHSSPNVDNLSISPLSLLGSVHDEANILTTLRVNSGYKGFLPPPNWTTPLIARWTHLTKAWSYQIPQKKTEYYNQGEHITTMTPVKTRYQHRNLWLR